MKQGAVTGNRFILGAVTDNRFSKQESNLLFFVGRYQYQQESGADDMICGSSLVVEGATQWKDR